MRKIVLATRGSKLALAQAEQVKALIEAKGFECELLIVKTKGDKDQNRPIHEIGGDGLFVREIEKALLDKSADIAVHSAKDLPYELAEGLLIAGVPKAASPADCLVSLKGDGTCTAENRAKKIIGTGSPRRICEFSEIDDEAEFKSIRGNIDTRLGKLDSGEYDSIILARAALDRLNIDLSPYDVQEFTSEEMIPAACQGIIAIECRSDDEEIVRILEGVSDLETKRRFDLERSVFCKLKADCKSALGVHAKIEGDSVTLMALKDERKVCVDGSFEDRQELAEMALAMLTEEI
jgi:hydroxymethylbilane synthase